MTTAETQPLVTIDDVRAAAERVRGVAIETPLLRFRDLGWVKPENIQPTGSFKIRGAYNTLAQLSAEQLRIGVVAHSSGNHAQAVARAARLLGGRAVIVMPDNAPQVKVEGVRADDAEIVFVGPHNEERVRRAHDIADEHGLELVSSADDVRVVAGQGTVGLEIDAQARALGIEGPLVVLTPVGLGGLASGIGVAIKALRPDSFVVAVEPALAADTHASLAAGRLTPWPGELTGRTIADGLRGEAPADIPFAHLQRHIDRVILVEEDEIERAVAIAARELKLVLEPSGAVSLAGLIFHGDELPQGVRIAVLSGGNVDTERYIGFLGAS